MYKRTPWPWQCGPAALATATRAGAASGCAAGLGLLAVCLAVSWARGRDTAAFYLGGVWRKGGTTSTPSPLETFFLCFVLFWVRNSNVSDFSSRTRPGLDWGPHTFNWHPVLMVTMVVVSAQAGVYPKLRA